MEKNEGKKKGSGIPKQSFGRGILK